MQKQTNEQGNVSLPGVLGVAGLVFVLAMLAFTLMNGPEIFLLPLGTDWLWGLVWVSMLIAGAGRLLTTFAAGWAGGDSPKAILKSQALGSLVVTCGVVIALLISLNVGDFIQKIYWTYAVQGIATCSYAMIVYLRQPGQPSWQAPTWATIVVILAVALSIFGIALNSYLIVTGTSGLSVGWFSFVFVAIPELVVRALVPDCYDYITLYLGGLWRAGRRDNAGQRPGNWTRQQLAAGVVISRVVFVEGFFFAGGLLGGWLTDLYIASHTALPDQLRQIIGIVVITRCVSYPIGGLGLALVSGLGARIWNWAKRVWSGK